MAASTHITAPQMTLYSGIFAWVHSMQEQIIRRRNFRRTYNELSALSAHQLADLGLHRSMLRETAYHSAYDLR